MFYSTASGIDKGFIMTNVAVGVWDRIVEFLRYEGKVTSREIGDLSWPWLQ